MVSRGRVHRGKYIDWKYAWLRIGLVRDFLGPEWQDSQDVSLKWGRLPAAYTSPCRLLFLLIYCLLHGKPKRFQKSFQKSHMLSKQHWTSSNILNNRLAISLQVLEPNLRARGSLVRLNGLYWMKKLLQPKHLSHSPFRRVRSFRSDSFLNFLKCQSSIWAGKDTGIMTDMAPLRQTARSSWDPESKKRFSSRQGSCELLQQCALGMQLHTWNSWPTVSILNVFGRHPNWIRKKTTQKEETKKGPAWRWSTKNCSQQNALSYPVSDFYFHQHQPHRNTWKRVMCLVTSKTFIRSLFWSKLPSDSHLSTLSFQNPEVMSASVGKGGKDKTTGDELNTRAPKQERCSILSSTTDDSTPQ